MKKFIFLLTLCLVSINMYAQKRDTVYCKQSEVLQKTSVVMGIPDSVYCDEATPQQNGQAYFKRKPVVLKRTSSFEDRGLGTGKVENKTKILVFKKTKGIWASTIIEGSASFEKTRIDLLLFSIIFFLGLLIGLLSITFPLLIGGLSKKRALIIGPLIMIGSILIIMTLSIVSFDPMFLFLVKTLVPILIGCIVGSFLGILLFKKLEKIKEKDQEEKIKSSGI